MQPQYTIVSQIRQSHTKKSNKKNNKRYLFFDKQEKQEAVAKAIKEKEVKENSNDNFEKTDTYICIKVNGLTKEATND